METYKLPQNIYMPEYLYSSHALMVQAASLDREELLMEKQKGQDEPIHEHQQIENYLTASAD